MKLSDFDYNLPQNLVAQFPSEKRDESRLMVVNRQNKSIKHKKFKDIADYLKSGDVLVINKSEVIPARLSGHRITGGQVEVLLLGVPVNGKVFVLTKSNSKLKKDEEIIFEKIHIKGKLITVDGKIRKMQFSSKNDEELMNLIKKSGKIPLPPYIKRKLKKSDYNRYQTVYASSEGSIASPTAGLHFTKSLLEKLKKKGIIIVGVTLHVNYATFNPVREEDIKRHKMYQEYYEFPKETVCEIEKARKNKNKVIAVGTTSCRVLETVAGLFRSLKPEACNLKLETCKGWTDLFIYPPYRFKLTDNLITNFHFPKSTLLMLVSAFASKDLIIKAYQEAIKEKYRFFSYGDCMIIL